MATADESEPNDRETEVKEHVGAFLRRNFPQIAMHGGDAAITAIDVEDGWVEIQLGGACSGCGISPMTVQAIKTRLPRDVEEIDHVSVGTDLDDFDGPSPQPSREKDSDPEYDAPF